MDLFMQKAIKEAKIGISKNHGGPFGCVIVKDNKLIAKAHNQVLKNNDCTCHGEMVAIKKACKKLQNFDLKNCILYTTNEPCPMCMGAILWSNIKTVYYGCTIHDAEDIGFRDEKFYGILDFNKSKINNLFQIDHKECLNLFLEYKNIKNKIIY